MPSQEYALDALRRLEAIPSPTGLTRACAEAVMAELASMGFKPEMTRKGAVICPVAEGDHPLLLCAHIDTLGAVVRAVKPSGRLRYSPVGGWNDNAIENENVLIHTRAGRVYSGTVQSVHASRHVWGDITAEPRSDTALEVVIDEKVKSAEDVKALGIGAGDFISFDPRFVITESGYIKSRFLDDKASAAVLLAVAKDIAEGAVTPGRGVTLAFTVYEEIGHGASTFFGLPAEDIVAVDMGCVGDDLNCTETQVSICAKDSAGPYDWDLTNELIARAKKCGLDYVVDVYPRYSSDAATALHAGLDARFACFGTGVFASHGYERTHSDGVRATLALCEDLLTPIV